MKINFNAPQSSQPLTYYSKASVEAAYKAQSCQVVVIQHLSQEEILKAQKDKYYRIIKNFGVSDSKLDELDFGLSGSIENLIVCTEYLPTAVITYTCGLLGAVDYGSDVVVLNVDDGSLSVQDGVLDTVKIAFQKGLEMESNPTLHLDAVAAEIGKGQIKTGLMVNDHFVSFYISIETSVKVNDLYTASVYVTMSISPLPGPPQDPTQVPVEYPLMNIALAFVQTVRVVEQIGATILLGLVLKIAEDCIISTKWQ